MAFVSLVLAVWQVTIPYTYSKTMGHEQSVCLSEFDNV